jgi:hypothetical protein
VVLGLVVLDLGVRAALVVLGLVARVARVAPVGLMVPAALVDRLVLGRADRVAPVVLGLVDPEDRVVLGLAGRVDLTDRVDPEALVGLVVPVVPDRMGPAAQVDRMGRVALTARAVPVVLVGLSTADRVLPEDLEVPMARAVPVDLVGLSTVDLVVPGDPVGLNTAALVAPAGRRHRPMCNTVTTTVVDRSGVVRETHRTVSALQVTARPHLRPRTDSVGMAGLLPERRRPTGTARRLPAVGTVRRPPAAGTLDGTVRHTISVGDRPTMARSTTTATTPHRFSTRCSAAGASGSSVPGSRCTDLSPA